MIGFAGLSHLGINYSLATAAQGFEVIAFDPSAALIQDLSRGQLPIEEPGLADLLGANRQRLFFKSQARDLDRCQLVFASLDVQTDEEDRSNTQPLVRLLKEIGPFLRN